MFMKLLKRDQRISEIEKTALKILDQSPGVVVRYRILRDVLRKPTDNSDIEHARKNLNLSLRIQELEKEQQSDGGWGAFHSRSTLLKRNIPSTEFGVERATALGLDVSHPILQKASKYIIGIMKGSIPFPDYQEKNNRWQTGVHLFLASTLSLIHPDHPTLNKSRELWHEIARRTFKSGKYREQDEINAHADLTGATVKDSYLVINNRYQLNILGSIPGMLLQELEKTMLKWIWARPDGIGYLGIPLNQRPPMKPGPFDRWLTSIEMISRLFPNWIHYAQSSVDWLWKQRNEEGYWDFGPRAPSSSCLPFSDNWKNKRNRQFDWTIRILVLLKKFYS
jgi:hypothetical protein